MIEYNALVKEHFFNPQNVNVDNEVGEGDIEVSVGEVHYGGLIKLTLNIDASGVIQTCRYKVYGNPYLVAGLSLWSTRLQGQSIDKAKAYSHQELIDLLEIPKTKRYCALLIEDALKKAIEKWQVKDEQ